MENASPRPIPASVIKIAVAMVIVAFGWLYTQNQLQEMSPTKVEYYGRNTIFVAAFGTYLLLAAGLVFLRHTGKEWATFLVTAGLAFFLRSWMVPASVAGLDIAGLGYSMSMAGPYFVCLLGIGFVFVLRYTQGRLEGSTHEQ